MKLNELSDNRGARSPRKRVGRGMGSGKGKTTGRGEKGQKSRSGVSLKGFEGGQMPLHRRLPKRGFKNLFKKDFAIVNLGRLQAAVDAKTLDPKQPIDHEALIQAGIVRKAKHGLRVLAKGEIKSKLTVHAAHASKAAAEAVEKAGGSLTILAAKAPSEQPAAASEDG